MTMSRFADDMATTSRKGMVALVVALAIGLALVLGALVPSIASAMEPTGSAIISAEAVLPSTGAAVSNLSVYATGIPQDARIIQAVAVLLVVGAGAAALIGAFVLRRRIPRDERLAE